MYVCTVSEKMKNVNPASRSALVPMSVLCCVVDRGPQKAPASQIYVLYENTIEQRKTENGH